MSKIRFISPSTFAFFKEGRASGYKSLANLLHGYIYARWTYLYIALATGRHPLSKRLAPLLLRLEKLFIRPSSNADSVTKIKIEDTYHGKVVPLQAARELVTVREDISLPDLEKVIPYAMARDIILKNPDHIAVLDCPCRAAREHPCLPLDVCLVVGEPFASFVVDHSPDRARFITPEKAGEIIKAEDERGHVHHAFFKDAMLGRFYAICNCCSCCCGAMHAQSHGTPMLASSGYIAQVDETACSACGTCEGLCQFSAIHMDGFAVVEANACMGCGVCVNNCPSQAISLKRAESRGEPLEIRSLIREFENGQRARLEQELQHPYVG